MAADRLLPACGEPAGQSNRAPRRLPAHDRHGEDTDDRHRVRAPRHGTWNQTKGVLGRHCRDPQATCEPAGGARGGGCCVACGRAAAMTGTVANLTGGEIVD